MPCRLSRAGMPRPAALLAFAVLLLAVPPAQAQQPLLDSTYPSPRFISIVPPGGKAGTVVEAAVAGVDFDEPEKLLFSAPGFKADLVSETPAPDPKAPRPGRRQRGQPNAPEVAVFKITIPPDAPLGITDVRFVGKWGVSNPRAFMVGDLPEVQEKEPNNDVPQAQRVDLNTTVNGTIANATDVDFYVFAGKKGQRVLISCLTSTIDSRLLADIQVYDGKNRMVGSGRNYSGNDALADCSLPDDGDYYVRLCEFTNTANIPGGPSEYFYRLTISTGPWIDAIYPPIVEPGKATPVTIYGRNLPGGQPDPTAVQDGRVLDKLTATITAPTDPAALSRLTFSGRVLPKASGLEGFEYRVRSPAGSSNPFLMTIAHSPVVLENANHETMETAQEVAPPCEVAGRFEKLHERDWYAFKAKKGDTYNIDIESDRIGAPTLTFLVVRDDKKNDLYESPPDNPETFSTKFFTRCEDPPLYRFTAPADGKYFVLVGGHLSDEQAGTGPRHYYRLRIAPDQPDFQIVVTTSANERPEGCTLSQGGSQSYSVYAWRRDGFAGDIALSVEGLPPGVTYTPQTIGGGARSAQLVLTAADSAVDWSGEIHVKGAATIKGQPVTREARAGGPTWPSPQPNQQMPLAGRVEDSLALAVRADKAPWTITPTIDEAVLLQGDPQKGPTKASITIKQSRLWPTLKQPIAVQALADEMPGQRNQPATEIVINNNQPVNLNPDQAEAKMPVVVGANVAPGVYTVVLRSSVQNYPFVREPKAMKPPPPVNINLVEPSLPLTITVLPRTVGTLSLATPNPTLKAGNEVSVVVKVARRYDYAGEFKVSLVPPANVKDVSAAEVVIPAGKDEATLVLKAPANAPPGGRNDLIVRAVAMVGANTPTTQEVKFNLNVTK